MNGEETRFKIGNDDAEKWTFEESKKAFEAILTEARKKECTWYSIQEAVLENSSVIPHRTFYYLLEKFPVLQSYKKELNDIIISKVNKGAITQELNPTACIWRMKQLGETDKKEVEHSGTVSNVISLGSGKKPD